MMKRNLNTSYRLVWNEVLGAFVVVSELAKAKGKRSTAVLALAVAGLVASPAALADDAPGNTRTVAAGEVVNGAVIGNHDSQIVFGKTNNTVINTGLEFGADNDDNSGGQWVQTGAWQTRPPLIIAGCRVYWLAAAPQTPQSTAVVVRACMVKLQIPRLTVVHSGYTAAVLPPARSLIKTGLSW
jgi:hypothetical protein